MKTLDGSAKRDNLEQVSDGLWRDSEVNMLGVGSTQDLQHLFGETKI